MTDQPPAGAPTCYRHPGRATYISCQRCGRPICPDCMTPASVGFQCPECVAEGRKSQRAARTTYGGAVAGNPALVTYTLIGINLAVWLAVLATGWHASPLIHPLSLLPDGLCQSQAHPDGVYRATTQAACIGPDRQWVPGIAQGAYWQLLTSAFLHVELWHIGSNMLSLYFLGPTLERLLGRSRFVALYLVSGLAGSTLGYWAQSPHVYGLGASGAIFGLLGALVVIARRMRADLSQIIGVVVINLVITFAIPNISWQAHIGGFLGGLAMAALLVHAPAGPRRARVQWLGTGGIVAVLVLAVVLRSATLA